jgi:hypothetical protein
MTQHILKLSSIVEGPHWVDPSEGSKVFEKLRELLNSHQRVALDFGNKEVVITAFLNAAIGPIFSGEFSEEQITLVSFEKTTGDDDELIRRVKDNALLYYSNKDNIDCAWGAEFDEE